MERRETRAQSVRYIPTGEKRKSLIRRFKAIVRLALANAPWLNEIEEKKKVPDTVVKFTLHIMQATQQKLNSLIPLSCKILLNKPVELRTEEDKQEIYKHIGKMKYLRKFPVDVQMELASHAEFKYYGPNRTIVRQGHEALAQYFILRGEVKKFARGWDEYLKCETVDQVGTLGVDQGFGEYEFMNNVPRQETIVTATPVEFLVLTRENFDLVLKDTLSVLWDFILESLANLEYFDQFTDEEKRECCLVGKVKSFSTNATILGDGEGLPQFIHFVLEGQCLLVQHFYIQNFPKQNKRLPRKSKIYSYERGSEEFLDRYSTKYGSVIRTSNTSDNVPPAFLGAERKSIQQQLSISVPNLGGSVMKLFKPDILPNKPAYVEPVFLEICTFNKNGVFSIGESLENRRVVAIRDTKILLIPLYWMETKGNLAHWGKQVRFLKSHLPDSKQIFEELIKERKYRAYKKDLVKSLLRDRRHICNTITNVPYSIRILNDFDYERVLM